MSLYINSNVTSLVAQYNLSRNTAAVSATQQQLSSGYRINKASDDAAGLVISEKLQSQLKGIATATQNAQDGVSILQIADGAQSVISNNLQRIRQLTVEAANDTNGQDQRNAIITEIKARLNDNQRIVQSTQFNSINLLTGSATNARLQIGANANVAQNTLNISSALATTTATALGILGAHTSAGFTTINSINFSNGSVARRFLSDIDAALNKVSLRRSVVGAFENQLSSALENLQLGQQNFTASESRVVDLNIATATSQLTQQQVLQQASVSILTQANQQPSILLKLLQ